MSVACWCSGAQFSVGGEDPSFIAETSFVKAPLNSRVASNSHNIIPRSRGKTKSKEERLDDVSLEIQEAMILEDLLFVLMVSGYLACQMVIHSIIYRRALKGRI
jgi:hypothetical protein